MSQLSFPNITPITFSPVISLPPKSLLFTLNSTENKIPIDWSFFKALNYNLYYKPHPLSTSDYSHYPDFVRPFASEIDPSQIEFGNNSFLVSFYSFSLSSTSQSISLARIYLKNIHPYFELYCNLASHSPSDLNQLSTLLFGKN